MDIRVAISIRYERVGCDMEVLNAIWMCGCHMDIRDVVRMRYGSMGCVMDTIRIFNVEGTRYGCAGVIWMRCGYSGCSKDAIRKCGMCHGCDLDIQCGRDPIWMCGCDMDGMWIFRM